MASPPTPNDTRSDKRIRILEAALEVCRRSGVEAARMEEVAARAQVSKGTLYQFFDGKTDLFLATLLHSYEESLGLFVGAGDVDADPGTRLEAALSALTRVLETVSPRMDVHYQAWGLVAREPQLQERLYGFLRAFHGERDRELEAVLREGQRRGVFRDDFDPPVVVDVIHALLSGFLYRSTFDPARAAPERLRACFEELLRGLAPAGRTPASASGSSHG